MLFAVTPMEQALWTGPAVLVFWGLPAGAIWLYRFRSGLPPYFEFCAVFQFAISCSSALSSWHRSRWVSCAVWVVAAGLWAYVWWLAGGNDRWRKLKRRIAERVEAVGSRLAVVPA